MSHRELHDRDQSAAAERQILPDLTRAFALIGIAVINVGYMAWPSATSYYDGGLGTGLDHLAYFAANALFLLKSYTLFAFMFGVGFAYQMVSAERRGTGFAGPYWRRIVGLLFIGLAHVALIFQGDILVIYAVLGALLFLFRNAGTKKLVRWAIGFYVAQVLIMAAVAALVWFFAVHFPEELVEELAFEQAAAEQANAVFGSGTFGQAVAQRLSEWPYAFFGGLFIQGFGAFSFFLFGLAAVRAGAIADPAAPIWRRARRVFLPIGLAGSAAGAWVIAQASEAISVELMFGMFLITLFGPFASAGYIGLIAKWAEAPATRLKTFLARGGTATLTAYLMQGLLFSLIFNNYGLGLFGTLSVAACTVIAFGVALFTIAFSSLWRTRFKRGPMEVLLRNWTYLGAR